MTNFWNRFTIILFIMIICLLLYVFLNYSSLEIANTITITALFVTILTTLYSTHKSDERANKQIKISQEQFKKQIEQNEINLKEQLLFNKKQDIYIKLYKDLNDYWELLDYERVKYYMDNYENYEPESYVTRDTFSQIHSIAINFNLSPDFLYMPKEIQEIVKKFLRHVDNNLEHYDYYNYDSANFQNALEILSEIFPLLKQEIGLKN